MHARLLATLVALALSAAVAHGATINIHDDSLTYSSLSGATVYMTGRSELHLTSPSVPLSNSQVNLNSPDAWLYFDNIRPDDAYSNWLSAIRVNGAAAVRDSNVRIVTHAMGTVVIPHAPSYQPLTVYSGVDFTGSSMQMGLYTYYRTSQLGAMNDAIRSFRLRRGYMATIARNSDGAGISRVYVANDEDVLIGSLPATLDRSVSFVRVFPWRWVNKKGWAGGGTGDANTLNCTWWYDWNNAANSIADIEYVPMRHNRWWNSYDNINNKQNSTHVLAFNEPERTDQADMTVAQALEQWPQLLASGLRLGSPAPSDGGLAWLYDFMDQADALDYRVDYVAVHYYKGCWSASQAYNWLYDIHRRTGRPLWVTEWNNGANWTGCTPTFESQATAIDSYLDMFNNAPFVERYSIYNWVGDTRAMILNGEITPAGIIYRDKPIPTATPRELNSEYLAHYRLDETAGAAAADISGKALHATLQNGLAFDADSALGADGRSLSFDGSDDYVQVPAGFQNLDNGISISLWARPTAAGSWARFVDLGNGPNADNIYFGRQSTGSDLIFAVYRNASGSNIVAPGAINHDQWQFFTATVDRFGNAVLYKNGQSIATKTINAPRNVLRSNNYIGRSNWSADAFFKGRIDDLRVCNYVMTPHEVQALYQAADPREQGPYNISPSAIPGRIQAEDYDEGGQGYAYFDTSAGNSGGAYRTDDVDILAADAPDTYAVWTASGEWLEYTTNVTQGRYRLDLRAASLGQRSATILLDGVQLAQLPIPDTGAVSAFAISSVTIDLPAASEAVLRLAFPAGSSAVDWLEFTRIDQWPYSGEPALVPGTVEAEDFDYGGQNYAYYDASSGNSGGAYRLDEDVDILAADQGYALWTGNGEWTEYTLDVPAAGDYRLEVRLACAYSGRDLTVSLDGAQLATIAVPVTAFSTFTTADAGIVHLPAGANQVLRLAVTTGGYQLDRVTFTAIDPCAAAQAQPGYTPLPGDLNNDCYVDPLDLAALTAAWLAPYDLADYADLATTWLTNSLLP